MAELLIYNKDHEWEKLKKEDIDKLCLVHVCFLDQYNARIKKGDIVEVRPDGYWTKDHGYRKDIFKIEITQTTVKQEKEKQIEKEKNKWPMSLDM
jgi:hypothetical protein